MAFRPVLLLALVTGSLSSCYSYRLFPVAARGFVYDQPIISATVPDTSLKKEYAILVKAHIFRIGDGTDSGAVTIRLHPLKKSYVCSQGIELSMITLGQAPTLIPDRYTYSFDQISKGDTVARQIELHVATRYWFWDLFAFRKHFEAKASRALAYDYSRLQ